MPRPPATLSGFVCPDCEREMTTVEWQFSATDKRITLLCIFCNANHGPRETFDV